MRGYMLKKAYYKESKRRVLQNGVEHFLKAQFYIATFIIQLQSLQSKNPKSDIIPVWVVHLFALVSNLNRFTH